MIEKIVLLFIFWLTLSMFDNIIKTSNNDIRYNWCFQNQKKMKKEGAGE